MDQELLEYIRRYLDGYRTLQDLESWVLSNLQRILDSSDEEAINAANEIDADLVELGEGLIDETTIREHLQSLISERDTILVSSPDTEPVTTAVASASDKTIPVFA